MRFSVPAYSRSTVLLTLLLPCAVHAQGVAAFKAVTTDDGVWVQEGDTKVLFYQRRLKSKDGKLARANYVHPLLDLDGESLTEDFPADHLHHRGIFWAWHQVTIGGKAVGDPWALKDGGWDIRDVKAESSDGALSLHTEVYWLSPLWLDAKGKQMPFVRERAIIKVHRAEKERRIVDFEIGLTALQPETRIGGAAPTPGYGGFAPRLRLPKDVRFLGPKGEVKPLAGPVDAAAWIDVAGTFANDRVSGVAMLTHPATPGFPQPWILRARGSMQNAVYPGATPVVLPTEKPMVLRYRLVIHRKAAPVDQLDRWHREYAQVSPALGQIGQTIDLAQGERHQVQFDERNRLSLAKTETGYKDRGEFLAKPIDLGKARSIRIDWTEQWTAPQTWKKHAGNPIFGPDKTGPWDKWTNGVSIIRLADGKTYRMFYAGRKAGGIGFAEASIRDPLTWKEHPASPVLKPLNNWEGGQINQPRVVKVTDTHWRMYYTGWGFKGPGTTWALGLAESFDAGLSWKRYQEAPILDRGPADSPDGGGACVPMVLKVGDQWMMWYTAALATPGKQNIHQCLATSPDGIRWTKYDKNPVLTDDFSAGGKRIILSRCYVRHDDGVFRMWYSYAKPDYRICYAESLDGKTWEKSPIEPVLGPSPAKAWDDTMVEYPEVDIVDGVFRLWFCGNGFGSVGYAEGVKETSVRLAIRSRTDGEWSPWRAVERGAAVKVDRFIQIRCQLESTNPRLSPRLNRIVID